MHRLQFVICGRRKCLHVNWWINVKERHLICFKQELDETSVHFVTKMRSHSFVRINHKYLASIVAILMPSSESNWIYYCPSEGVDDFSSNVFPPLTWAPPRHINPSNMKPPSDETFMKLIIFQIAPFTATTRLVYQCSLLTSINAFQFSFLHLLQCQVFPISSPFALTAMPAKWRFPLLNRITILQLLSILQLLPV